MAYEISKPNENTCVIMGIFGMLVALTTLIQHLTIISENWLSFAVLGVYILPVFGYIIMMKKSRYTDVFLWISTSLLVFVIILYKLAGVFSMILFLLFAYNIIALILLYILGIKKEMDLKYQDMINEDREWAGKI